MKKKALSIVDIAKQLNISQTTVSFILNGKARERRISPELTGRVLSFVEEVGYKPNLLARSFRTGKTHIIGLMVEDISNPFFAHVARRIEEKAYANGYKILYCSTENDSNKARELLLMLKDRCVDGYIITPTESLITEVEGLVQNGAPVVLFDRRFDDDRFDYVLLDNAAAARIAVEHLVAQGYRRIGFLTIDSAQSQMRDRLQGYRSAMQKSGLPVFIKKVGFGEPEQKTVSGIVDFLQQEGELDAIIFSTNYLGISGLRAIGQLNLNVPSDLAVLSFDDHILFELNKPGISSIAQPLEDMSDLLINTLLNKLSKTGKQSETRISVPGELIVRGSTTAV